MKCNFVLIPSASIVSQTLISLAKEASLDLGLQPDYLLREKQSLPHISVVQFELIDELKLNEVWILIRKIWQSLVQDGKMQCYLPHLINYKKHTSGAFAGLSWAEIVIDKNENPLLQILHDSARTAFLKLGVQHLNAVTSPYHPHFTLFNVETEHLNHRVRLIEIPISLRSLLNSIEVKPALGAANDNWELVSKIYE